MLASPADVVAKAKAKIKECSIRDVQENESEDTLLIDVREPAEFSRGHLPGAIHIPRGLLEFEIGKLLASIGDTSGSQKIIVYCGTGGRSALAARSLGEMGLANVISMDGGVVAWNEAGFPLEVTTA